MQIFTPISARYLSAGKNTYFSIQGTPLGATQSVLHRCSYFCNRRTINYLWYDMIWPSHAIWPTFLEALIELIVSSNRHVATYRFRDVRFLRGQNFGFWGFLGVPPPKWEKQLPGPTSYHHGKFHADWWFGVTVAEISVPVQKKTYSKLNIRQNAY